MLWPRTFGTMSRQTTHDWYKVSMPQPRFMPAPARCSILNTITHRRLVPCRVREGRPMVPRNGAKRRCVCDSYELSCNPIWLFMRYAYRPLHHYSQRYCHRSGDPLFTVKYRHYHTTAVVGADKLIPYGVYDNDTYETSLSSEDEAGNHHSHHHAVSSVSRLAVQTLVCFNQTYIFCLRCLCEKKAGKSKMHVVDHLPPDNRRLSHRLYKHSLLTLP
jgi:hypothetical protein